MIEQEILDLLQPSLWQDIVLFVKAHPVLSGLVATWAATTESLPFFKRVKASGALHGVWVLLVTGAKLILKLNQLRGSGKEGQDVRSRKKG